ncbi:tetratricopeptide repeat protein 38-like [Xenia sp. Carnegie-2017]|uniref:tetratricopeptide repeat protein 38-like n=1 Tax=Xenia sp. Carnegie-2017 TaxID=2897299 RepID=UPI001F03E38E|nr:tetratricopeptide repeat protein 38-like [Xenia sp. Carnegie-2017]
MSSAKHREWRDLAAWKSEGLSLSTTSDRSAKLFDAAVTQYLGWYDDPNVGGLESSLKEMMEGDPDFVMGQVLSSGLELIGTGTNIWKNDGLRQSIDRMVKLVEKPETILTDRERKHVTAIQNWSQGFVEKAGNIWEDILNEYPTDVTALKFAHDSYFYLGYQEQLRDSIAKVMPHWNETMPLYGFLNGMYAFGLVETNFYNKAETYAKKGLQINPYDCWSTHALCHVIEMEGRNDEGIKFLDDTEEYWTRGEMLACHNYWHWALYHIEKEEYETAIDIYDQQVSKRCKSGAMLDLVDGSSLLYRLELEGVNVKDRWREMRELWGDKHADDHVLVFNDLHLLMCTLRSKDEEETKKIMQSLKDYMQEREGNNRDVCDEVGLKMCEAFEYFDKEDYEKSTDLLAPLRYKIVKIGGSNAQRDIFNQFLIHSALRSPRKSHQCFARALLAERKALKSNSPLTDRLISKAIAVH